MDWDGVAVIKSSLSENPVRQLRKSLNLTQEELSNKLGVSTQVVYLTESGVYNKVPQSIASFYAFNGGTELNQRYQAFITVTRLNSAELFDWENSFPVGYSLEEHPFVTYREHFNLARQAIAKLLCVQPALLYRLETGKLKKLPTQLVEALRAVGVKWETISLLNTWSEKFYWHS